MADTTATTAQDQGKPQDSAQTPDLPQQARELGAQVRDHAQELGAQVHERAQELGTQLKEGAQEAIRQVETSASQLSAQGREAMGQLEKTLEDYVRAKPLQSLLIAAGVGMMAALLWKKQLWSRPPDVAQRPDERVVFDTSGASTAFVSAAIAYPCLEKGVLQQSLPCITLA